MVKYERDIKNISVKEITHKEQIRKKKWLEIKLERRVTWDEYMTILTEGFEEKFDAPAEHRKKVRIPKKEDSN